MRTTDINGNYICNGACSQLAAQNKTNTLSSLSNLQRGTYFPQNAILQQAQMGVGIPPFENPFYLGKAQCEIKIESYEKNEISYEHLMAFLDLNNFERKVDNLDYAEYVAKANAIRENKKTPATENS